MDVAAQGDIHLNMQSFIYNFKTYEDTLLNQEDIVEWLIRYHGEQFRDLFLRYAVGSRHIKSKQIFASGILENTDELGALYGVDEKSKPNLKVRAEHAQKKTNEIFKKLYEAEENPPAHLNHVSCSHYQSPSGAQQVVVDKAWHEKTSVTHLYHMGCYASMPALRVSDAYLAKNARTVDVVHTELCSFHLDKESVTPEQIIMKTLFADGAIKYSMADRESFDSSGKDGLELLGQKEVIVPNTENEMTWKLGAYGFMMTLTRKVPILLSQKIKGFLHGLFQNAGLSADEDKHKMIFAVHPGGPKVIELVEKVLELSPQQLHHSKRVLETRGNMSSATLPFIWESIINDQDIKSDTIIATLAFGPGLTMTGAVFKLCRK